MRYYFTVVILLILGSGLVFAHGTARDRGKRGQQVERTAAASPQVIVSACTLSGSFTVRGWDRNEVRVRVSDGVEFELTRIDANQSQPASELKLTTKGRRATSGPSCLMSADVEMDVPRAGGVKLQTTSGEVTVTEIGSVKASSTSGRITITRMHGETNANTVGGDLSVRDSSGSFKLHSTSGEIDARELRPAASTDNISVSSVSGEVVLTQVKHQRVDVNSVSGETTYAGALVSGGRYDFQNLSGEVRLLIPAASSFRLTGTVGENVRISSDFELNYGDKQHVTGVGNPGVPRRLSATIGSGDAAVRVTSLTGTLQIKKQ
jgi:hypothetical protein